MVKYLNKVCEKLRNCMIKCTMDSVLKSGLPIEKSWVDLAREYAEKSNKLNPNEKKGLPKKPEEFSKKDIDFMIKMVKSELLELKNSKTFAEQIDAIVDAIYYLISLSAKKGVHLERPFRAVHRANMRKFVNNVGSFDKKTGKNLKPVGWIPPEKEIENIIQMQKIEDVF